MTIFTITPHHLLTPRDLVQLAGVTMTVTAIHCLNPELPTAGWTLDLEEVDSDDEISRSVTLTTQWDWPLPTYRTASREFLGLDIGDVVTRGKGKLLWRVTGLAYRSFPVVSLLSMPGGSLSPQTFGCADEAIATLRRHHG